MAPICLKCSGENCTSETEALEVPWCLHVLSIHTHLVHGVPVVFPNTIVMAGNSPEGMGSLLGIAPNKGRVQKPRLLKMSVMGVQNPQSSI